MRLALILAVAFAVLPACKSHKQPENMQEMKKKVPDAKPSLHVAEDDPRYVASSGSATRQVHYYSVQMDTTYVVDESTGKVVTTFKTKEMPGVVVIDKPAYEPPPLEAAEGCAPAKEGCGSEPAKEGCGCAAEVEEVEEATEIEEVEGCGCGEGEEADEAEDADEPGDTDEDDEEGEGDDDGCGEGCSE